MTHCYFYKVWVGSGLGHERVSHYALCHYIFHYVKHLVSNNCAVSLHDSHTVWETWENGRAFSSQGKVKEF